MRFRLNNQDYIRLQTIAFFIPFLLYNNFSTLIICLKASLNVKITKYNKIVHQIHEEEETKAPVIGFHIPTEGDEDFEDDEDY